MRGIGVKGSIAVITASAAVLLLFLAIIASQNIQAKNTGLLHMEAAKETALKTENLLGILDKSVSNAISMKITTPSCTPNSVTEGDIQTKFTNAVNEFEELNSKLMNCTALVETGSLTRPTPNTLEINGTMNCTTTIGETTITDERSFIFSKRTQSIGSPPTGCEVYDTVSECREQPSVSCT